LIPIIFNVMKRLNLIFLLVLLCYLISCNRKGCTDPKAMGSNPGAKKDCCCLYETSLVIWFDEQTIQNLEADFISNLTYYLDGDSISRSDLSYTDSLLMCHHINSLTYNMNKALRHRMEATSEGLKELAELCYRHLKSIVDLENKRIAKH
jgi:hypothetical protein